MRTGHFKEALLSTLLIASLLMSAVLPLLSLTTSTSASGAVIWTEDAEGNPKTDFEPDENVYIRGSGFSQNVSIEVTITRPDNSVDQGSTFSDGDGNFVYVYQLDGIYGTYSVTATDADGNSASATFEDRPKLEGFDKATGGWTSGNLSGWKELDWVPYRIKFKNLPKGTSSYTFNVYHNNLRDNKDGIDALRDFRVGDENGNPVNGTVVVKGPSYKTPGKGCDRDIYCTLSVSFTTPSSKLTWYVYWQAHLAFGASGWPGASLHAYTDISGTQDVPINVPPVPTGSISGSKWDDLDRDSAWDLDEPALSGWTIQLYFLDPVENAWVHLADENTNATGSYTFGGLVGGDYYLAEILQSGWIQTYPSDGIHPVTLSEGESRGGIDFGNFFAVRGVEVAISPSYQSGLPGSVLTYTVIVTNTGTLADDYDLSAGDTQGWNPTISPSTLSLAAGESGSATLSVAIPSGAVPGTTDDITVIATSRADPTVSASDSCVVAVAIVRGVEVSILPDYQSGAPGATLAYSVIVKNVGNVADSYTLTAWDNAGWLGPWTQELIDVPPGENRTKPLSVTIPYAAVPCTRDNIVARATSQADPNVSAENSAIAHAAAVVRAVAVSLAPESQENLPGTTVSFTVAVRNEGDMEDNFVLTARDNENWGTTISPSSVALPPGASDNATLSLTIPKKARGNKEATVVVSASSAENAQVSASDNGVVKVSIIRGVDVSVSPSYQAGEAGATLVYIVTVTNTGNVDDNFYLSVSDSENWRITYWFSFIDLPSYSSARSELTVTIPENAVPCTRDNIVVTATSMDNVVSDSDSFIAHRAKAEFRLVTLYKAGLDVDLYIETGSRLVVKFYTYAGSYQGESIVWSGSTPDNVKFSENVPHPENQPVERTVLVLTDDGGNVISTMATFVVTRSVLWGRMLEIKGRWLFADPDERDALWSEILAIKGRWLFAPA